MKDIKLSNDKLIPVLGYGTWRLPGDTAADLVYEAIKLGYRHIDCAAIYGNEKQVGVGIKRAIDEGLVKREDLFVTSKLWNTEHEPERVSKAFKQTLKDLSLDYVDLYLLHWAVGFESGGDSEPLDEHGVAKFSFVPIADTWKAMESLAESGTAKAIGVANFNATQIVDLMSSAKIKPAMNRIELHPYLSQQELITFCQDRNIAVTAYSPLGSTGASVLDDKKIADIAKANNCTPAQAAISWNMQRKISVIPRTANIQRMKENLESLNISLSQQDLDAISALNMNKRFVNPIEWWGFPYF